MSNISTTKEEQYTLFTIETANAYKDILAELWDCVVQAMEMGNSNFILNFDKVRDFEPSLYVKLDEINHIVIKENGILVVACLHVGNSFLLKDLDIIATSTLSEASDYVFMEEIERQFLTDPDETPEKGDEL